MLAEQKQQFGFRSIEQILFIDKKIPWKGSYCWVTGIVHRHVSKEAQFGHSSCLTATLVFRLTVGIFN